MKEMLNLSGSRLGPGEIGGRLLKRMGPLIGMTTGRLIFHEKR